MVTRGEDHKTNGRHVGREGELGRLGYKSSKAPILLPIPPISTWDANEKE
jgi:hypothetical protein